MANRVSQDQIDHLLDFLMEHSNLATGVGLGTRSKETVDRQWDTLASTLNALGTGSSKTGLRWKKYWFDLKHKAKTRALARRRHHASTGGGLTNTMSDLSETDQKVLAIIGTEAVFGDEQHRVPLFMPHTNTVRIEGLPILRECYQSSVFSDAPVSVTAGPSRRPVVLPPRGQHLFEHVSRLAARLAREFGSALVERPAFRAVLALLPLTPAQLAALTADHVAAVAADLTDDPLAEQETCNKGAFSGTRSYDSEDSCGDSESEAAEVTGAEEVVGAEEVSGAMVKVERVEVEYDENMIEYQPPDGASVGVSTGRASLARTSTGGAGTDLVRNGRTSTDHSLLRLFNFDEDGLPRAKRSRGAELEVAGAGPEVAGAEPEAKGATDAKPKGAETKPGADADVAMSGFLSYAGSLLLALPRPARLKAQGLVLQLLMREHAAAG